MYSCVFLVGVVAKLGATVTTGSDAWTNWVRCLDRVVVAHESRIACFKLARDGGIVATASSKGTLVRVWDTRDGSLLQEVRRGADRAEIYSLAFSSTNEWLAVSRELIRDFLKSSASQLTIYGLFSLQEGLKERELCVFFHNNHFNTMFKFEGELYILATDQGYLNQPDLVWEKLNEVNGDTVFVNNNFKKFNPKNHDTRSWDQQNAMADTADYIAKMDNADTSFK
ncbi:hypothetical protein CTI12_AA145700 [Artemisia annua]|uniref:MINDY deubiquitinase domain-containing protein n=1 Tax=Artemisia annua TaxID=35608 RepID=A0A2U1PJB5_ARTAN|nr:hypothetical protein CTI12_AA145700 [Artemisia annua]